MTSKSNAEASADDQVNGSEPTAAKPQELTFVSDKGASRSTWIAALLVVAIVGWMGSGFIFPIQRRGGSCCARRAEACGCCCQNFKSGDRTQFYQAEGQALPDRDTMMRAETSGDIAEVLVRKGQDVAAGDVIARFDAVSNAADADRAAEELARAQREFENAEKLLDRGVATADRVSQARATLAAARAQVTIVEQAAEALDDHGPFRQGGSRRWTLTRASLSRLEPRSAVLVDITPLTVAIQVPQQSLTRLSVGQTATVQVYYRRGADWQSDIRRNVCGIRDPHLPGRNRD